MTVMEGFEDYEGYEGYERQEGGTVGADGLVPRFIIRCLIAWAVLDDATRPFG